MGFLYLTREFGESVWVDDTKVVLARGEEGIHLRVGMENPLFLALDFGESVSVGGAVVTLMKHKNGRPMLRFDAGMDVVILRDELKKKLSLGERPEPGF